MYIIKVRPDRKLGSLRDNMQKIMDEMLNLSRPVLSPSDTSWTPEADIYETEHEIFVVVNLAGVQKDDIEVTFHNNRLRIAGNRLRILPAGSATHFHHLEIGRGEFDRVLRIPVQVENSGIKASYVDGLLTVRMKKRSKSGGGVRVKVKT